MDESLPRCSECGLEVGEESNGSGFCDVCLFDLGSRSLSGLDGKGEEGFLLSEESGIRLLERVGAGSYGVVWRGTRARGEDVEEVAVKLFQQRNGGRFDRADLVRFERSARVLELLEHASVVKVSGFWRTEEEVPCLVMEYVRGETLESFLRGKSPHEVAEEGDLVLRLMEQVADAAGYFHGKGVVHRDLKPGNLLVVREKEGWRVVVIDFDLLCLPRDAEPEEARLTGTTQDIGTKLYMAPEQFTTGRRERPGPEVGAATDVYAMGVMLCVLLTNKLPYGQVTPSIYMEKERRAAVVERCGHLPRAGALQAIVEKCLELHPGHRYKNGAELAADLQAWREGRTVQALRWAAVARTRRWLWQRRTAAAVAVVAALGFWGTWNRAEVAEAARQEADVSAAHAQVQEGLTRKLYGQNLAGLAEQNLAEGKQAEALALYAEAVRLDPEDAVMVQRAEGVLFSTPAILPVRGALRGVKGGSVNWTAYDASGKMVLLGAREGVMINGLGEKEGGRVLLEKEALAGAFSPDGKWLALAVRGEGMVVYGREDGKEAGRAGAGDFYAVEWSGDSRRVMAVDGGKQASCFEWKVEGGMGLVERWSGVKAGGINIWLDPTVGTRRVRFSRDGGEVISTMDSMSVAEVLDAESGSVMRELGLKPGRGAVAICLEVWKAGWVTAGGGGDCIFWPADGGAGRFFTVPSRRTVTRGLASAGTGRFVLCDMDGKLGFYTMEPGGGPVLEEERELGFSVKQILMDREEKWLVVLDENGTVTVWRDGLERATSAPLRIRADEGSITRIVLAPAGNTLASLTDRGDCVLWDLNARKIMPAEAAQATSGVAFSGSGKELVGFSADGREVMLWRADDLAEVGRWPHGRKRAVDGNSMVPDAQRLGPNGLESMAGHFWHQEESGFLVWRSAAEGGREVSRSKVSFGEITAAALNPAGTALACVEAPHRMHVFSLDGKVVTLPETDLKPNRVGWSADGTRVIAWAVGNLPFSITHLTDPPVTTRLELGGSPTVLAFLPAGVEQEPVLLVADEEHALSVLRLGEGWRKEVEYPVRAKVLRILFRAGSDGLRVQLLLVDGGLEERLWSDLGTPIQKREASGALEVTGDTARNGLLAWLEGGRVNVIDGASGRPVFDLMNEGVATSSLAFSPDGLRLAVAGGTTRTLDLPPAERKAAEWLPALLNYRSGLQYVQTTREYRATHRRKVLEDLMAVKEGGEHRVLDWFLGRGETVSPFSRLTAAEECVRWFLPEAPRRLTGEQFPTPWPVHRLEEKLAVMRRDAPGHVMSLLSDPAKVVKLEDIPAITDSAMLLRTAELLYVQDRNAEALGLLKRDAALALAGQGADSRLRKCLQVMEAFVTPGRTEAGWWLAFEAGWMPEKSYRLMLEALEEAEGWRCEPVVWEQPDSGKPGELLMVFYIKRKETLVRLRAEWEEQLTGCVWVLNGVRLGREQLGSAPTAPGRGLVLAAALAVKVGRNELKLIGSGKPETAELGSFRLESAEAPLVRFLAYCHADGKVPADGGAWQPGIDRGRAMVADFVEIQQRGQAVIGQLLPADSPLGAAAGLLKPMQNLGFFQFLDLMEGYPMKAGVQVEYFQMAAANLRRTATKACENGQAAEVRAALPRVKALGEKSVAVNPEDAAGMRVILDQLLEDLNRQIQAAGQ